MGDVVGTVSIVVAFSCGPLEVSSRVALGVVPLGVALLRVVPPRVAAAVVLCRPCAVVLLSVLAFFCPSFAIFSQP
jgi:hypothetical protein